MKLLFQIGCFIWKTNDLPTITYYNTGLYHNFYSEANFVSIATFYPVCMSEEVYAEPTGGIK